ncbi:MAG: hypothetical protein HY077_13145 [Elusimicrobia bacterium]|nr:hypothetical protein [Elusimicrobiota bacterium]
MRAAASVVLSLLLLAAGSAVSRAMDAKDQEKKEPKEKERKELHIREKALSKPHHEIPPAKAPRPASPAPAKARVILPPRHEKIPPAPPRPAAKTVPSKPAPRAAAPKEKPRDAPPPPLTWGQTTKPPVAITDGHLIKPPATDERGAPLQAKPLAQAPQHDVVVANAPLMSKVVVLNRSELKPNQYYWHNDGGLRYCHYRDRWGSQWYGFYSGPTYYWTRYNAGYWWWYDQSLARWLYWNGGHWWWQGPYQAIYVYNNNTYVPDNTAPAAPPTVSAPAAPKETEAQNGDTYFSPDGSRLVQIYGNRHEAFLYARYQGEDPHFLAFLERDVTRVQFSDTKDPDQLQILLFHTDGTFSLLDSHGRRYLAPEDPGASAR